MKRSLLVLGCVALLASPAASQRRPAPDPTGHGVSPSERTAAQLRSFYAARGGRAGFPVFTRDAIEAALAAEDAATRGEFDRAERVLSAHFSRYPLGDGVHRTGVSHAGANIGDPVAYSALRMLQEVARAGRAARSPQETLTMTVVLVDCAEGQQARDEHEAEQGGEGRHVRLRLDPRLRAARHRVVRQSLSLFRQYIGAITEGEQRLDVRFEAADACGRVGFRPGYSGLLNPQEILDRVPTQVHARTDMWWVLYPSNIPRGAPDRGVVSGGMHRRAGAPVFVIEDRWLLEVRGHHGNGSLSDVERRLYLPSWLLHEFFHHLYASYPALGLEPTPHAWHDRTTWPGDYVGRYEADYYMESMRRRIRRARPRLATRLRRRRPSEGRLRGISAARLAGRYERRPVENPWHQVTVERSPAGLTWRNAAGHRWSLTGEGAVRSSGERCPYGAEPLWVELARDEEGRTTGEVAAIRFHGERFVRATP